jgi:hypothetical protein
MWAMSTAISGGARFIFDNRVAYGHRITLSGICAGPGEGFGRTLRGPRALGPPCLSLRLADITDDLAHIESLLRVMTRTCDT